MTMRPRKSQGVPDVAWRFCALDPVGAHASYGETEPHTIRDHYEHLGMAEYRLKKFAAAKGTDVRVRCIPQSPLNKEPFTIRDCTFAWAPGRPGYAYIRQVERHGAPVVGDDDI